MACFHPKKGFVIGTTENGKPKYKILPWEYTYCEKTSEGWKGFTGDPPARLISSDFECRSGRVVSFTPIPCGKCIGCRLDYAKQWSARLLCEFQEHDPDTCWFLTLTYADEAFGPSGDLEKDIDFARNCDACGRCSGFRLALGANSLGEAVEWPSLCPRDSQLFWKRLRKAYPGCKISYFLAGEYGGHTGRPHLHAIVYGLPLDSADLIPYEVSELGDLTYKCQKLDKIWKNGFVVVGKVTLESCSYVARYCLKKIYNDGDDFSNRVPEFVRMSRRPGLGRTWLEKHPEIFEVSQFSLPSRKGSNTFCHPRYFLKYLEQVDPDRYESIKADRAVAGRLSYENLLKTDSRDYLSILKAKELDTYSRCAKMKRKVD